MISPKSAGLELTFNKNERTTYDDFVKALHTFLTRKYNLTILYY